MVFRRCNGRLLRWALLGLVMCMFFGLLGCSSPSPEEAAVRHLEKKYGGSYVVGPLTKKEHGPFMTKDYSGFAYEKGRPLERFTVWVSSDHKTVKDARYATALHPAISRWVQAQADSVWDGSNTAVLVDVLRYNSQANYGSEDFMEFYRQETVNNTVLLTVQDDEALVDHVSRFLKSLEGVMTGYVRIYLTASDDMEALLDQTPDAEIMIGSSDGVIREKLDGL